MHVRRNPIIDRKVRFALVGCGRIASNHFEAIKAARRALRAGRRLRRRPEGTGSRRGARPARAAIATWPRCWPRTSADCVILTTPSGLHPAQAIEVARAGRHVMTEKPMATRWQRRPGDGARLRRGRRAPVRRQAEPPQSRRCSCSSRRSQKGRFGRIYMVNVNVFWTRPQSYYDSAAWRGTWEFDGGAFMNQASHYVDLLDWLIGPVESVHGLHRHAGAQHRGRRHRRRCAQLAQRRAGLDQRHDADLPEEPRRLDHDPRRKGHGAHRRRGRQRDPALGVRRRRSRWTRRSSEASYETTSVYGFGHPLYYDNVINALRGEAEPETDGREGLKSLELLIAMYLSARDGKRVACRWRTERWPITIHPTRHRRRGRGSSATDCRVWHFVHISAGARIGARCSFGQNVFVGNDVRIGDNVQDPEQRLGL